MCCGDSCSLFFQLCALTYLSGGWCWFCLEEDVAGVACRVLLNAVDVRGGCGCGRVGNYKVSAPWWIRSESSVRFCFFWSEYLSTALP